MTRSPLLVAAGLFLAATAHAANFDVRGETGLLGEWAFSGSLAGADGGGTEHAGALTLTHIGQCSPDGPEEKQASMTLRTPFWVGGYSGTLVIDGATCSFRAFSDGDGTLRCPDRPPQPFTLTVR